MPRVTLLRSTDGTLRQKKKPSPYYGHVNGSTCMCMAVISNKKQTTNLSSAFLEVDPNHRQESRDGFSVYSATSTE